MKREILPQIIWQLVLIFGLLLCLWLAFQLNSFAHYHFDFFYDFYHIEQHIQTYAPQNKFKSGFELLNPQAHIALFNQIVDAVHQRGIQLESIYYNVNSHKISLLTAAEIIHLIDVKNLIHTINLSAMVILPLFGLPLVCLLHHNKYLNWRLQLSIFGVVCLSLTGLLFIIGSETVFYQFHQWIFPDNHQWFFYYQESLMSTLMKAPTLFAGIAWFIVTLGFAFFALLLGIILYIQHYCQQQIAKPTRFRIRKSKQKNHIY